MLFTKASEYALLAMICIAQNQNSESVDVDTISEKLQISRSFLAKILQSLAKSKLLNSFKGAKGGFSLAKKPSEITLFEIITSAEKRKASIFDCTQEGVKGCPNGRALCRVNLMFNELQDKVDEYMQNVTLQDIIKKER
ncbi:MAG: RrF2 family transcriptional regulator [Campylobacter sp.]|nr:RrF2 family transcriptional regulator [Campylobacter sp.]